MEGKSGFSPAAPGPILALAELCAHTCVCERLRAGPRACSEPRPLPTALTRPSLLAWDHRGHRQHGTASGSNECWAEKRAPTSLTLLMCCDWGKGTSEFMLDFDRVGSGAENQTEISL